MEVVEGTVTIGIDRLTYVGSLSPTPLHAHATFQFVAVPNADLRVRNAHGPRGLEGDRWLIPPRLIHAIDEENANAVVVYIEPEGRLGTALALSLGEPRSPSLMAWRDAGRATSRELLQREQARLAASLERASSSVADILRELPVLIKSKIFLTQLAGRFNLDRDMLADIFAREIGLSFRAYVRWLRMRCAVDVLAAGGGLSDANVAGGFPSIAEMNRAFRVAFGFAPAVTDRIQWRVETTP